METIRSLHLFLRLAVLGLIALTAAVSVSAGCIGDGYCGYGGKCCAGKCLTVSCCSNTDCGYGKVCKGAIRTARRARSAVVESASTSNAALK
ncbi:hypothetical protein CBR_g17721 [Chara braunii]|uniref:Granulins domain-containing protein n=1 Tax=Chara braunii TaxID=69332 RepID=A0A388KVD9_CHABU|nr:hypothetical protein CBR_g17721 [Chara braunii]|eukprot:GBG74011.1 hypothetical protein CBR_g17721 [Chara braunii]